MSRATLHKIKAVILLGAKAAMRVKASHVVDVDSRVIVGWSLSGCNER